MSHSDTTPTDDSGTTFKTIDNLRYRNAKQTGCVTLSFSRKIDHLPRYAQTKVCNEVARQLNDWVDCFTDTDDLELSVDTVDGDTRFAQVEHTIELPDRDDRTVTRALNLTRSVTDSMESVVRKQEWNNREHINHADDGDTTDSEALKKEYYDAE